MSQFYNYEESSYLFFGDDTLDYLDAIVFEPADGLGICILTCCIVFQFESISSESRISIKMNEEVVA
jgi:hypothetical protein